MLPVTECHIRPPIFHYHWHQKDIAFKIISRQRCGFLLFFFPFLSFERKKKIQWDFLHYVCSFQICPMDKRYKWHYPYSLCTVGHCKHLCWSSQQFCETQSLMPFYRWEYRVTRDRARMNMNLSWADFKSHTLLHAPHMLSTGVNKCMHCCSIITKEVHAVWKFYRSSKFLQKGVQYARFHFATCFF